MYFEKLTELDKRRIENYIDYNVGCLTSPLEEVLAPWDKAKSEYLSKIFGIFSSIVQSIISLWRV